MKNRKFIRRLLALAVLLVLCFGAQTLLPEDAAPAGEAQQTSQAAVTADYGILQDSPDAGEAADAAPGGTETAIDEDGSYDSKDEVALYIHTYGHLPSNYITKAEAEKAGWNGGPVDKYCPGKCIGGGRFGNYEGLLPDAEGRVWTECDINTLGASSRGPERIVFSNDGLIYYTPDHYDSFELLYG